VRPFSINNLFILMTFFMYIGIWRSSKLGNQLNDPDSKPGNRGKRDSQILLLHCLNRVHFDLPMSPLELEIYHQMTRRIIGIDPAFMSISLVMDVLSLPHFAVECSIYSFNHQSSCGYCGHSRQMFFLKITDASRFTRR
jgi:Chitin synthase